MKKPLKKVLSLMMVLALFALPLSALAEGGKLHTVKLSNFEVKINEEEPIKVDLSFESTFGMDADNFYYAAKADAGKNPVANFQLSGEDETLKLKLDGMKSNYQITMADLEQLMKAGMESATGAAAAEMPFDPEDLQKMVESYVEMIQSLSETEKLDEVSFRQMLDEAGIAYESKAEQAQVFDETIDATRYDVNLTLDDMDKMMAYIGQKVPAYKDYMDAYVDFMQKAMAASGEGIEIDKEHLIKSMYAELGVDLTVGMSVWSTEDESKTRVELNEVVAITTEGDETKTETVKMPCVVEAITTDDAQKMRMTMDMDAQGDQMNFTMDIDAQGPKGAQKGLMTMKMTVAEKDAPLVGMDMRCTYDETAKEFDFRMAVDAEDVLVNIGLSSAKNGDASRVTLAVDATEKEEKLFAFSLGFDFAQSEAELPAGQLLDLSDKPVVNIAQLTQEDAAQFQTDVTTVGIMGYGALMQTEGVAKLLSMAMTAATQMITEVSEQMEAAA